MKKKFFFLFLLLFAISMAGCGQEEEMEGYHIEYLNNAKDAIVKVPYEPKSTERASLIEELLIVLWSDSESVEYRKPIPTFLKMTAGDDCAVSTCSPPPTLPMKALPAAYEGAAGVSLRTDVHPSPPTVAGI